MHVLYNRQNFYSLLSLTSIIFITSRSPNYNWFDKQWGYSIILYVTIFMRILSRTIFSAFFCLLHTFYLYFPNFRTHSQRLILTHAYEKYIDWMCWTHFLTFAKTLNFSLLVQFKLFHSTMLAKTSCAHTGKIWMGIWQECRSSGIFLLHQYSLHYHFYYTKPMPFFLFKSRLLRATWKTLLTLRTAS